MVVVVVAAVVEAEVGVGVGGGGGDGGGGGGGGVAAVMFVLCVISPDHWLIVLLILSDYWPAAPTRGWCWVPVFSVMVVTPQSNHNINFYNPVQ